MTVTFYNQRFKNIIMHKVVLDIHDILDIHIQSMIVLLWLEWKTCNLSLFTVSNQISIASTNLLIDVAL